jgi:hypothetical protein
MQAVAHTFSSQSLKPMELRNRATGAIITGSQFRAENKNTSFPQVLTPEIIDSFGYDPVLEGPQATTIPPYQYSQRDGVVEINGQWFTHYIAGPIFTDYTDDEGVVHTASEQYEAYCFGKDAEQGKAVRTDRNKRLADCDWTQLADSPLDPDGKLAWALYRETLRMVPQQAGFPWEVVWPEEP